jgi:Fe-S oxidoreductase
MLSLPENYSAREIPSGCCGMAGSFGYEAEHHAVSMKIASLVLLPYLEKLEPEALVAAAGTSCRHQIHDGIARTAQHPARILRDALR